MLLEGADSPILTGLPTKALFVTIIEKNKKGKCIRKQNANTLTSQIETRRQVAAPPEMQARMIQTLPANVLTQDNIRFYIVAGQTIRDDDSRGEGVPALSLRSVPIRFEGNVINKLNIPKAEAPTRRSKNEIILIVECYTNNKL